MILHRPERPHRTLSRILLSAFNLILVVEFCVLAVFKFDDSVTACLAATDFAAMIYCLCLCAEPEAPKPVFGLELQHWRGDVGEFVRLPCE